MKYKIVYEEMGERHIVDTDYKGYQRGTLIQWDDRLWSVSKVVVDEEAHIVYAYAFEKGGRSLV